MVLARACPLIRPLALATFIFALVVAPLATVTPASAEAPEGAHVDRKVIGDPLPPGSTAVVSADGQCLRVREAPSLDGEQIACLNEGTTVSVLPSYEVADDFRWQLVTAGPHTGYVADEFLEPFDGVAASVSCQTDGASTIPPGLTGFVPSEGGVGMVVWGGGTLAGIDNHAASRDCRLTAVWTNDDSGEMVPYLVGVPDFVNEEWGDTFPTGHVPAGRVLFVICSEPDTGIAHISSVPLPGFSADPPVFNGDRPAPEIGARAAVVIDEESGAVLYQKDAHESLPPASLTKIATAILALEGSEPSSWIVSDVDSRRMPGSSVLGLIPGDCFRVSDLMYGLMLPSGNDVALAIGRYMGGSDEEFIHQMNTLVARLGLTETQFTDPHGLGGRDHYASAYDIAMLSRYAMTLPAFREVVAAPVWTAKGGRPLSMYNVNAFVQSYPGADGVKTGYTEAAGRTLSASAVRDGRRLYVVVMNDQDRDQSARALLDWAFDNHTWP
ncbi:MAG: SH3 domain-containing protein [Dehalococcoidia bacterium]